MSGKSEIRVGDIGTSFRTTIRNESDVIQDISDAIDMKIILVNPKSNKLIKDAVLVNDGTDGQMQYVTQAGDLDIAGTWQLQGYIKLPDGEWYSTIESFQVHKNL